MKAITLTQPWASLVALGEKKIETRGWTCYYTGPVAIHAAKTFRKREFADLTHREPFYSALRPGGEYCRPEDVVGHVIAIARIVSCMSTSQARFVLDKKELAFGNYADGRWAFKFADVQRIKPVKATGALGLWDWDAPYEVIL
jgi:hypothetical protein